MGTQGCVGGQIWVKVVWHDSRLPNWCWEETWGRGPGSPQRIMSLEEDDFPHPLTQVNGWPWAVHGGWNSVDLVEPCHSCGDRSSPSDRHLSSRHCAMAFSSEMNLHWSSCHGFGGTVDIHGIQELLGWVCFSCTRLHIVKIWAASRALYGCLVASLYGNMFKG